MEKIWEFYRSGIWVEPFLHFSIASFLLIAAILFILIIAIRSEKIERRKRHILYEAVVEKIFMLVVFENRNYNFFTSNPEYTSYLSIKNFRKQMLKSIINLHQNYDGVYAKKLETFYFESGLIKTSLSKMKSNKWQVVCSGIQELAEMNVTKAFPALVKISKSKNKEVKIIAIKACAKLNGNKGIVHLTDHKDPIDLWTQVNIIGAFKRNYVEDNEDTEKLLTSQNTTVVSLGLKIIQTLELASKVPYITHLIEHAPNDAIKLEAQDVLRFLITKTKSNNGIF